MQTRTVFFVASILSLSACGNGTNPLFGGGGGVLSGDTVSTLPGTAGPSPSGAIKRTEDKDKGPNGTVNGNGTAHDFSYDVGTDTFTVDGLAFDGDNTYARGSAPTPASLGPFQVYESAGVVNDDVTLAPIGQYTYRAVRGESASGNARFSIVRTGSYAGYGFGGFLYERDGAVTLPTSGTQALFTGQYAGLRDFVGSSGIEYVHGQMQMAIDLRDFDEGNGIQGVVTNRRIYSNTGVDITNSIIATMNAEQNASLTVLPSIVFSVGPNVMDLNGEMEGEVTSPYTDNQGSPLDAGSGRYYAVLSGTDEVVGVIVTEGQEDRVPGATVRETGGFILYR